MVSLLELLVSPFPKRKESEEVSTDEIEKCVVCEVETPYKTSTHIDGRAYYIQGAGQLCGECHFELYVEKPKRIPDYFCD
tara:strand:+ start:2747 stop:2986 length:240 start_codon:yes stop_codon:yes gene_type:complete